jgi:hypothetical protein
LITIDDTNIAWSSDSTYKFKNTVEVPVVDGDWKDIQWLDMTNERFIVWMRTSGLPTFRKLWGRIDKPLLPPAIGKKYFVRVYNHFELVTSGKANQKKFVISTMNSLGGKNFFLAYCFIVMGLFCILISVIFCGAHMKKRQSAVSLI